MVVSEDLSVFKGFRVGGSGGMLTWEEELQERYFKHCGRTFAVF